MSFLRQHIIAAMTRRWPDFRRPARKPFTFTDFVLVFVGSLIVLVAFLAIILMSLAAVPRAHAHDDGRYSNSPHKQWFSQQRNKRGSYCCDESDGHPFYGNYTINKDGSVTLDIGGGKTTVLPEYMVLTGPNPTGVAIWWYADFNSGHVDYCFAPGSMG